MKMKAKHIKIINLIVAVLVALFAIGQAFAWLATGSVYLHQGFGGSSAGAYFAYGEGSEEHPFGIETKYHMYNLAWLQNTGRLIDQYGNPKKYYFELSREDDISVINMDEIWLPPIGNDENPFIGEFNGRGKAIANLKVTTDKTLLTANPASPDYEFSNAVGMFGMTAEGSEVANFTLTNPIVEAASTNTKYATEWSGEEDDTHSKLVIGLAVGHVAGKCYSVGIRATEVGEQATTLMVNKAGYSTFNSILGELAPGVTSSVTGGGHAGGTPSGAGGSFGNTFDVDILYSRLESIALAKYGKAECVKNEALTAKANAWRLPNLDNSSDYWTMGKGEMLAFAKVGDHYSEAEPYEEVAKDSTGYFLGNQTKIQKKTLTFAKKLTLSDDRTHYYATNAKGKTGSPEELKVTPAWFYTQQNDWKNSNYEVGFGFAPVSQATFDNLPQNIKNLLYKKEQTEDGKTNLVAFKPGESGSFTTVRVQANYTQTLPSGGVDVNLNESSWSYHGQITWNGNTYGLGLKSDLVDTTSKYSYAIDEDGNRYTYDGYLTDFIEINPGYGFYYRLNDDKTYEISLEGWNTPVFNLNSNGEAVLVTDGGTFSYYTDGNLIDENNYLFSFENGERRYVSALEGWALPIYGVNENGYALDENGERYTVNAFYELDENNFYKRKSDGTYVIKTPDWTKPIYVVDENGYALTEAGGKYYTTTLGVYNIDGTCKFYDEDGNKLILVDGQFILPYGFDDNGYAVTADGLYYTSTAGSYLKYEDGAYYRVGENGIKQINDNGRIVTPYGFVDGYAVNEEGFYYNKNDTNVFYDKRISTQYGNATTKYYQVIKSTHAGDIWTYVFDGSSLVATQIDDNGYAMCNDDWRYTTMDDVYEDANGYNLHGDGGYILDAHETWNFSKIAYFGDDGILYAKDDECDNAPGCSHTSYAKGAYYVDKCGYVITTTGAYALDSSNNITGEKIPYHVNSSGQLTYSAGVHVGEVVTIVNDWFSDYCFSAEKGGYNKIKAVEGSASNLATAITGNANDRLMQAEGTLEDRVQATHDDDFLHKHVMVKTVEDSARPKGVSYQTWEVNNYHFHQMTAGIFLPNNGVWFKPAQAGMIRFVMWADTASQNFALLKIERQIHADGSVSFDDKINSITKVLQQPLPAYCMFYYEYEVTPADIEAGNVEFVIMRDNTHSDNIGGSFLLYLDVGASALVGGDDPIDIGAIDMEKNVSAIDFIYEGVEITQKDLTDGILQGDFIVTPSGGDSVRYENSKTSVYFENIEQVLRIVFVRLYSQPDDTTIQITVNSEAPDEVKATHTEYLVVTP